LGDHGVLLGEEVLDRVFDGEDSAGVFFVDAVDDGGDGGGFAGAGDSGDEDESLLSVDDIVPDVVGEAYFLNIGDFE
jgi:hypothetical protein